MQIARHSSGLSGEFDLAAEIVQSPYQSQDHLGAIATGEVIGAQILVFDAVFQHMPCRVEHRGRDYRASIWMVGSRQSRWQGITRLHDHAVVDCRWQALCSVL